MIIVAGHHHVTAEQRDGFLAGSAEVVRAARDADGCVDFALSADLVDPGRVNVFEQWESVDAVQAFRGSGPDDETAAQILGAVVHQHEVVASRQL